VARSRTPKAAINATSSKGDLRSRTATRKLDRNSLRSGHVRMVGQSFKGSKDVRGGAGPRRTSGPCAAGVGPPCRTRRARPLLSWLRSLTCRPAAGLRRSSSRGPCERRSGGSTGGASPCLEPQRSRQSLGRSRGQMAPPARGAGRAEPQRRAFGWCRGDRRRVVASAARAFLKVGLVAPDAPGRAASFCGTNPGRAMRSRRTNPSQARLAWGCATNPSPSGRAGRPTRGPLAAGSPRPRYGRGPRRAIGPGR
jgi:hypothetical protein